MKFYVSLTATEATTADGQPLVRGGEIELSPEQRGESHNARLIAEGQLISISQQNKAAEEAQEQLDSAAVAPPSDPVVPTPTPGTQPPPPQITNDQEGNQ